MQSTEHLSAILLDPTAETSVVNGACAALYDLLASAAIVTADAARGATPSTRLTTGLSLSPDLAPGAVEMEDLGIVFQVDAKGEFPFETPTTLTVRCEASGGEKWPALATRIRVHGDEVLDPYASGLTTPEILWPLSPLKRDTTIELRYDTGLHPQVTWRELR